MRTTRHLAAKPQCLIGYLLPGVIDKRWVDRDGAADKLPATLGSSAVDKVPSALHL